MGYRSELIMTMSKKGFEFLLNEVDKDYKQFILEYSDSISLIKSTCPLVQIVWSGVKLYEDQEKVLFSLLEDNQYYCEYNCIGEEYEDITENYNYPHPELNDNDLTTLLNNLDSKSTINDNEYQINFTEIEWQSRIIREIEINEDQEISKFDLEKEFPREYEQYQLEKL